MKETNICPHCGTRIYKTALAFCPDCGTALDEERTRKKAIESFKRQWQKIDEKGVGWRSDLPPKNWLLRYMVRIIVVFVIVILLLMGFTFLIDKSIHWLICLIGGLIVAILVALVYLDKTPLYKNDNISFICKFLRKQIKNPPWDSSEVDWEVYDDD